jgi:hypothetical protein
MFITRRSEGTIFKPQRQSRNILMIEYSSFADISNSAMFQDIEKLLMGGFLMFVYIQLQLSKCNWVELRVSRHRLTCLVEVKSPNDRMN